MSVPKTLIDLNRVMISTVAAVLNGVQRPVDGIDIAAARLHPTGVDSSTADGPGRIMQYSTLQSRNGHGRKHGVRNFWHFVLQKQDEGAAEVSKTRACRSLSATAYRSRDSSLHEELILTGLCCASQSRLLFGCSLTTTADSSDSEACESRPQFRHRTTRSDSFSQAYKSCDLMIHTAVASSWYAQDYRDERR